jgi:hypothetical protein
VLIWALQKLLLTLQQETGLVTIKPKVYEACAAAVNIKLAISLPLCSTIYRRETYCMSGKERMPEMTFALSLGA